MRPHTYLVRVSKNGSMSERRERKKKIALYLQLVKFWSLALVVNLLTEGTQGNKLPSWTSSSHPLKAHLLLDIHHYLAAAISKHRFN